MEFNGASKGRLTSGSVLANLHKIKMVNKLTEHDNAERASINEKIAAINLAKDNIVKAAARMSLRSDAPDYIIYALKDYFDLGVGDK